jgi:hypothetical protein
MSIVKPAAYDKEVLYAFRALFDGKANEGQQKRDKLRIDGQRDRIP